jgi:hypothetical protein
MLLHPSRVEDLFYTRPSQLAARLGRRRGEACLERVQVSDPRGGLFTHERRGSPVHPRQQRDR